MDSLTTKTPAEIAEEARTTGHDAMRAAQGIAQESKAIGADAVDSMRATASDAKATATEALDTAKGLGNDVKDIALDAVNLVGKKVTDLRDSSAAYIAKDPTRALGIAMAGGALFAALLTATMRRRRR